MSDIVRYEEPANLTPTQQAADYKSWAPKLANAAAIAREVAQTDFVPAALRGKPAAVTAAILAGSEIGIGPMASLNQIHVIEGRPALSAELARALVLAHGHHIRYREMTTTHCVVEGRRRGEDDWTTVTWTMDDAKRARLNGKQNWQKYPRRMLAARATSELCRMLFADTLAGMAWTVEELEDDSDDVAIGGADNGEAPRKARRKTATRRKATTTQAHDEKPADAAEPALPDEDGETVDVPDVLITGPQLKKLQAIFTEHGIGRDERLRISSTIIDRQLSSAKELTLPEAGVLIDTLERCAQSGDFDKAVAQLVAETDDRKLIGDVENFAAELERDGVIDADQRNVAIEVAKRGDAEAAMSALSDLAQQKQSEPASTEPDQQQPAEADE